MALLLSKEGLSKVRRLDYATVKQEKATLETVCKTMTKKEIPLASSSDVVNADCMGELFSITDFCKKKFKDKKYLVRGFVDPDSKDAYCLFSSNAILKWECPTYKAFNCKVQAKVECQNLGSLYAATLPVFKAYYSEEGPDKMLNCVFNGAKVKNLDY